MSFLDYTDRVLFERFFGSLFMKQLFWPLMFACACGDAALQSAPDLESPHDLWSIRVLPQQNTCGAEWNLAPLRSGFTRLDSAKGGATD